MANAPTQYSSNLIQALRGSPTTNAVSPGAMLNLLANSPNTQAALTFVPSTSSKSGNIFSPSMLAYAPKSTTPKQPAAAAADGQGQIFVEPELPIEIGVPKAVAPVDLVDPVEKDAVDPTVPDDSTDGPVEPDDPIVDPVIDDWVDPIDPDTEDPVVPDEVTKPDDYVDPIIDDWIDPVLPDDTDNADQPKNPVEPVIDEWVDPDLPGDTPPDQPKDPVNPVEPTEPDAPVEPPVEPPIEPVAPPIEPDAPVEPGAPDEPVEPPIEPTNPPVEPAIDEWVEPVITSYPDDSVAPFTPASPVDDTPVDQSPDTGLVDAVTVADAIGISPDVAQQIGITEDTTVVTAPISEPQYDPVADLLVVPEDAMPPQDNYGGIGGFDDLLMMEGLA